MQLNKVVLPEPFGPIKPVILPRLISMDTPLTAFTPPKLLYTSVTFKITSDLVALASAGLTIFSIEMAVFGSAIDA